MTIPTKKELDEQVELGFAEKRGDKYFLTPLGQAIAWAQENVDPSFMPPEGIRYQGYLITGKDEGDEYVVNVEPCIQ